MREIKFRVFKDGKMYYLPDTSHDLLFTDGGVKLVTYHRGCPIYKGAVENLMQYTGLKDKSGTEIYDGDLVKIDVTQISHLKEVDTYEVVWNEELTLGYGWGAYSLDGGGFLPLDGFGIYEVVGNIYENPIEGESE